MDQKQQNKDKDNKDAESGQPVQLDKEQQGNKPGHPQGGQHQGEPQPGGQQMPNREPQQGGKQR